MTLRFLRKKTREGIDISTRQSQLTGSVDYAYFKSSEQEDSLQNFSGFRDLSL